MSASEALFAQAQQYIPGGVNSPVRAFKSVGGTPPFFSHAKGAYLFDEDNRKYIDYVGSWGPMILGHQDPDVVRAVSSAIEKAMSFGAPTKAEVELAKLICTQVPSIEQIRMVNSGTEATMTALRLARGYTGRDLIVKFEGCYHGHSDSLLIKAGSGALTLGQPSSPGVPADLAKHTLNLEYNNINSVKEAFATYGHQIAALIVEPIPGNMGCILPQAGFLETLRVLCDKHGTILIFDEVITGFRIALAGAQQYYHVQPDLTTLGKIIGGGMPVGALGGKKSIMSHLSPVGPVYQAGTLSGNPVAMTAGFATLAKIANDASFYGKLAGRTEQLVQGFKDIAKKNNIPLQANSIASMFSLFFNDKPVTSYQTAIASDVNKFNQFYHGMLQEGIYFGPSAYETAFVSIAHDEECMNKTLCAAEKVFRNM